MKSIKYHLFIVFLLITSSIRSNNEQQDQINYNNKFIQVSTTAIATLSFLHLISSFEALRNKETVINFVQNNPDVCKKLKLLFSSTLPSFLAEIDPALVGDQFNKIATIQIMGTLIIFGMSCLGMYYSYRNTKKEQTI